MKVPYPLYASISSLKAQKHTHTHTVTTTTFVCGEASRPALSCPQATTETRLKAMRVTELREECGRLGLVTTGVKADLVARLRAYRSAPVPQCILR